MVSPAFCVSLRFHVPDEYFERCRVEWFKLFLDPLVLRDGQLAASARLPQLPAGKQPIDCITDYLSCLWRYAKERIIEEIGIVADLGMSLLF